MPFVWAFISSSAGAQHKSALEAVNSRQGCWGSAMGLTDCNCQRHRALARSLLMENSFSSALLHVCPAACVQCHTR